MRVKDENNEQRKNTCSLLQILHIKRNSYLVHNFVSAFSFSGHPMHSALAICILALMEDVAGKLPFHHSSKWWDVRKEDNYTILNSCLSEEAAEERGNLLLHSNIYFSRFVSTTVF